MESAPKFSKSEASAAYKSTAHHSIEPFISRHVQNFSWSITAANSFLCFSQTIAHASFNMSLSDLLPRSDEEKFLGSKDSERLEKLKPIIIQLYMGNYGPGGKRTTMRQITEFMKDKYAFHLGFVFNISVIRLRMYVWYTFTNVIVLPFRVNQLEYNLREKWKMRRRILNREKDDVTTALGKRARTGASTSDATLQEGKPLDTKQLKRHLQDKIRRFVVEPMVPGV